MVQAEQQSSSLAKELAELEDKHRTSVAELENEIKVLRENRPQTAPVTAAAPTTAKTATKRVTGTKLSKPPPPRHKHQHSGGSPRRKHPHPFSSKPAGQAANAIAKPVTSAEATGNGEELVKTPGPPLAMKHAKPAPLDTAASSTANAVADAPPKPSTPKAQRELSSRQRIRRLSSLSKTSSKSIVAGLSLKVAADQKTKARPPPPPQRER